MKKYQIPIFSALIAFSFFVGQHFGKNDNLPSPTPTTVLNKETGKPAATDFSQFWNVWELLNEKQVSADKITDQQKVYGAIKGLADSYGDPYTVFFPPQEAKMFKSEISGNFEGVGMEVGVKDNILTVIAPLKNTPSEKAGMKAGDKIIQIDHVTTQGMSVDQAIDKIRGKGDTAVVFTLIREGKSQPFDIKVIRARIDIPTIETQEKDGVFVISLYSFSEQSPQLFRNALRSFVLSGSDKLLLDLRGNPGGYLEAAVDMASWFLPEGKVVVSEDFNGKAEPVYYRSKGYNIFNSNLKMAILVDKGSASASEILSGALQEYGIAKLVGTKTYGKGSVQELIPITKDTSLKVTIAKWLTPHGLSISDGGLTPDIDVQFSTSTEPQKVDVQFNKAIEVLTSSR